MKVRRAIIIESDNPEESSRKAILNELRWLGKYEPSEIKRARQSSNVFWTKQLLKHLKK